MTEQTKEQITALALANGFKLKAQPDGSMALNPYVFDFAHAVAASAQPPQQSAQPVEALGLTFVPWSKEAEMLESWTQPAQPVARPHIDGWTFVPIGDLKELYHSIHGNQYMGEDWERKAISSMMPKNLFKSKFIQESENGKQGEPS